MESRAVSDEKKVEVKSACPVPCKVCPWRLSNQGTKHPHNFYSKSNLARLWKGLREGVRMSCHETDPRMAEFAGYESLAERDVTHECAGALTLQQRELMKYQDIVLADPSSRKALQEYKQQHPKGLTRNGLVELVERFVFGGTGLDGVAMSTPDLNDTEIGYDVIGAWRVRGGNK
jgi:hypothetical protein